MDTLELTGEESWPIAEEGDESPLTEMVDTLEDYRRTIAWCEDNIRFYFQKRRQFLATITELEADLSGYTALEQAARRRCYGPFDRLRVSRFRMWLAWVLMGFVGQLTEGK